MTLRLYAAGWTRMPMPHGLGLKSHPLAAQLPRPPGEALTGVTGFLDIKPRHSALPIVNAGLMPGAAFRMSTTVKELLEEFVDLPKAGRAILDDIDG
ncbi:MAG TPA: hypothetical protein PLB21_08200 [Actinomycetota bacterium]|nr:hypothetical protein [Actinomycetota bacterium]